MMVNTPNRNWPLPGISGSLRDNGALLIAVLGLIDADMQAVFSALSGKVDASGAAFTNSPTAPTPSSGDDSNKLATTAFVNAAMALGIANLINGAPEALNALNELAAAMGNNPNFAADVAAAIGLKANSADVTAALALKLAKDGGNLANDTERLALANASKTLSILAQTLTASQIAQFKTNVGFKGVPEDIVDIDVTSTLAYVSPDLSAYRRLFVDYTLQPASAAAFYLQFSSNGGSSWGDTKHFQQTVYGRDTTVGAATNSGDYSALVLSTYNAVLVGGAGSFGRVELMEWNKAAWTRGLLDSGTHVNGTGALLVGCDLIGYSQAIALNALRIVAQGGVAFSGNIRLRGVRG